MKIKQLRDNFVLPTKIHDNDACYDLTACTIETVNKNDYGYVEYMFGFAADLPRGYCALIFPRSSISNTGMILSNSVGIIDEGYKGEWRARFKYIPGSKYYEVGDRVAQFMLVPYSNIEFQMVDELEESSRSDSGHGSTGN